MPDDHHALRQKKLTTKLMIIDALVQLKSRKGVSGFAIKKHLSDKFQVNTERINFMIKKALKTGVEDGTIIQLKGIGASGSFKLANVGKIKKPKKKREPESGEKKVSKSKAEMTEKPAKKERGEKMPSKSKAEITEKPAKKYKDKKLEKGPIAKTTKKIKESMEEERVTKKSKAKVKPVEEKVKKTKVKSVAGNEQVKNIMKMAKGSETPAKKRTAMMKRKSIGSIIKPPKMKPK